MDRSRCRGRVLVKVLAGVATGLAVLAVGLLIHGRKTRDAYVTVNDAMVPPAPDAAMAEMPPGEFGATQGGVQDMGLARELIQNGRVPPPAAFTVEGMFSEHDLPLTGPQSNQLFQLRAATAIAPGPDGEPAAWVQVGMSSNLDVAHFERPSLTLLACVDVSGSMGWGYQGGNQEYPRPAVLARKLLHRVASQLGPQDRFAMVTYGSDCATVLSFVKGDQQPAIAKAIDGLHENGSTNMEAGLRLAYREMMSVDFGTDQQRIMLFTDEQPNVGMTSSTGFEQMVLDGAEQGTQLTIFGLGMGLNSELTKAMSHIWGANAFSLRTADEVDELMADSWPWMVSPIAYDLRLDILSPGLKPLATYGFPAAEPHRLPRLEVSTIFLSKRRGGLLLCLPTRQLGEQLHVPDVSFRLRYLPPDGPEAGQILAVSFHGLPAGRRAFSQPGVQKAVALAMLVDGLKQAAEAYERSDQGAAIERVTAALERFKLDTAGLQDPALENEQALASKLQSLMATGAAQGDLYGQGGE